MTSAAKNKISKNAVPAYKAHEGQQTHFHESQAIFEVLYGGQAGGGKSAALVAEALRQLETQLQEARPQCGSGS